MSYQFHRPEKRYTQLGACHRPSARCLTSFTAQKSDTRSSFPGIGLPLDVLPASPSKKRYTQFRPWHRASARCLASCTARKSGARSSVRGIGLPPDVLPTSPSTKAVDAVRCVPLLFRPMSYQFHRPKAVPCLPPSVRPIPPLPDPTPLILTNSNKKIANF